MASLLLSQSLTRMRSRPGHITSWAFFTASMAFTFYKAPSLQEPILRYACAGTAATLFCEVIMHGIDTVNMRSKIINGPKLYVFELIKLEGFSSLMRGIQPVLYGYFIASLVYFYAYAQSKQVLSELLFKQESGQEVRITEQGQQQPTSIYYKTMAVSFIGSGFAEFLSLAFYYPFDLIKTRMQVASQGISPSQRYLGTLDATLKIINEGAKDQKLLDQVKGIKNLYKGGFTFGMSYTAYMAVQFSLFESILLYLEIHSGVRQQHQANPHGAKDHSWLHISIASFLAGALGGLLTNPIEFLAVNIQTQENFSTMKYIRQKGVIYDMMFKGGLWRSVYHGLQAVLFFIIWQEYAMHLNVDIAMFEE
ncbi:hypothetical protein FGO68_gene7830 [Halteria grandinella]|uniref:Uncharacterized protein n=1 Tax=Halteria grandinella TaxID=5974 RepID=A0A8J8NMD5_HALGN|nr:hypothetical protein FGO68_gene7830 [Halteria grandinella]